MKRSDEKCADPALPVTHGLNHYEPSDEEIRLALRFSPERQPENAAKRKRRARLVGGVIALSGAVLAYWGYRLGGLPMAIGMLGAATVGTLFRLLPSLLAAQARRADREKAKQIAIRNRFRIETDAQNPRTETMPSSQGQD